jgi:transposase
LTALFAIESEINGSSPQERQRIRHERSRPLLIELEAFMREQRVRLSAKNQVAK